MNFTQTTRHGMTPKSRQKASLTCGMPLPAASVQKRVSSQPAMPEVMPMSRKLPTRKRGSDWWARRSMPFA